MATTIRKKSSRHSRLSCWLVLLVIFQLPTGFPGSEMNQENEIQTDTIETIDHKDVDVDKFSPEKDNTPEDVQDLLSVNDIDRELAFDYVGIGAKSVVNDLQDKTDDIVEPSADGDKDSIIEKSDEIIVDSNNEKEIKRGSGEELPVSEENGKGSQTANVDSLDGITNNVTSNSSVVYSWFKYFLDSFLEEFKEGISVKQSEKENNTNASNPDIAVNQTSLLNFSSVIDVKNVSVNDTAIANTTEAGKKMKFECIGRNITDNINATVKIITSAKLLQLLSIDKNETENTTDCIVVMFYAPWCKFCAKTAPHFNALARAFPQLDFLAVDTAQFSNILARFGTVSVPNVLVFHQSRTTVKFNQTERVFPKFVSFLKNVTGLEPNASVSVTDDDYRGPVPSEPTDDPDYLLLLSWLFVIFCSTCMFIKSTKGQQWITRVRVLWQEHQHID